MISGIAFYGWSEGPNVRVVLLVRVPAASAENKFYSSGDASKLSLEQFASYRLGVGESRRLEELKSATFGPYSIRIESRPPISEPDLHPLAAGERLPQQRDHIRIAAGGLQHLDGRGIDVVPRFVGRGLLESVHQELRLP